MAEKFVSVRIVDRTTYDFIRHDHLPEKVVNERAVGLLELAKSYIQDPKNWIKGAYFGRHDGVLVRNAQHAEQFCMMGAWIKAHEVKFGKEIPAEVEERARFAVLANIGSRPIPSFNDDKKTTHEMVMEAFDKAIKSFKVRKTRMNTLKENQKARRSVTRSKA